MITFHTIEELKRIDGPVTVAIGVFDGVHLGHQALIQEAQAKARQLGGKAAVLTFHPHPMRVMRPQESPLLLTSTPHKLQLLGHLGVECAVVQSFTEEFSRLTPAEFIESIHNACVHLTGICVGRSWTFGHRKAGNVDLIASIGRSRGFEVHALDPVNVDGEIVSSTLVRRLVAEGRLSDAAKYLGRPYSIFGEVVRGRQIGRTLGFPTANIACHAELFPPDGVYAVECQMEGKTLPGVANIGVRPTVSPSGSERILEIHLIGYDGDLYGKSLETVFRSHLRGEMKFDGLESLKRQIAADVVAATEHLRQLSHITI